MREEVLRISEVTYAPQGGVQLENFCLNVFAGEIVGIIPINGHGLAALIELLRDHPPLRAGYVYYREELVNSWRAPRPHQSRICVIQSTSCLVGDMTVADNIFVLRPGFKTWLIRPRVLVRQLQPVLDSLGAGVRADAYADSLTSFQRVVVELVKALVAGSRLVILREISTIISDMEMARLGEILRRYAEQGLSFLYIGYHYEEMVQICDRTAVFSGGRIIKIMRPEDGNVPYEELYMRRVREQIRQPRPRAARKPVLEVSGLCGGKVRRLHFAVAAGECVVLQDLQNTIFSDLIAMLLGERKPDAGTIRLGGCALKRGDREIAVIREHPDVTMIFRELSGLDNLCMTVDHRLPEIWRSSRVREGLRREWAGRAGGELLDVPPALLSRRQRYDLVYQRIMLQRPRAVFCVQPFSGLDVGMRMHIWELLRGLMDQGVALVILAVNLADTFTLADRLVRVEHGEACEIYERSDFDRLPFSAPWLDLYKKPWREDAAPLESERPSGARAKSSAKN